jgi:hypothetical protein
MVKKLLLIVLGVVLLISVIVLGILASKDPSYVIWFGLSAAILAPLAFVVFGHALKGNDHEILAQLSKVPQVRELMDKARSEEDRIKILEAERDRLDETIRVEARRQMLSESRSQLEKELDEKIKQYDATLAELRNLEQDIASSPVRQEIDRVRERLSERKKGRVIVIHAGKREMAFSVRKFGDNPLSMIALLMLLGMEKIQRKRKAQPEVGQVSSEAAPGATPDEPST